MPGLLPHQELESALRSTGFKVVAGIDEAGRGPLAGPVVAAACILPENFDIRVNDSKKLSPTQRDILFHKITEAPNVYFGVGVVDSLTVDSINILQATLKAMQLAVENLPIAPDFVLIDGPQLPKLSIPAQGIIKGDGISQSIAAASILAKVTRDRMMDAFDELYPEYGFKSHKGYGTKRHYEAIQKHGLCLIHRKSFNLDFQGFVKI